MSYHYDDNVDVDNDDDDDGVHDHHSYWTCPICGVDFHCSERLIFHWDTEHRYSRPYVINHLFYRMNVFLSIFDTFYQFFFCQ